MALRRRVDKRGQRWLALAIVLFIAAIAAAVSIVLTVRGRPAHFLTTTGTVVDVHRGDIDEPERYSTTINFSLQNPDGIVRFSGIVTFRSEYGSSATRQGDTVPVWYDPLDPVATAETDADRSSVYFSRGWIVLSGLLGSLLVMTGPLGWWPSNREEEAVESNEEPTGRAG